MYRHPVTVQSDHKPLGSIFLSSNIKLVIDFREENVMLKYDKYDIKVLYLPVRDMLIANILSRS